MNTARRLGLLLLLAAPSIVAAQTKQIVFLAGTKDHGIPGRHEYEKDLRSLAYAIDHATNLKGVTTKVVVGRIAQDLSDVKRASVIVIESSSERDGRETHPLFPPDPTTNHTSYDAPTTAYLKSLDSLIKTGVGVVILHYASWVENWAARGYYVDWTGGLWVQMISKNPNDRWSIAPQNTSHPVLRGVKPWTYRDEIFSRYFLPDDPHRTNLLVGTPATSPIGPQVVSWAYQRADGGRGLVFGGADYHDNMKLEDFRRFLLNGIVWAAGMDVPAGGVQSPTPPDEPEPRRSWSDYGGGSDQSRFVALDQITKANVGRLTAKWTYSTADSTAYQFNPIIVDSVMYVMAKDNSLVALNAVSGRELWIHANLRGLARRGMNYWESPDRRERRLLFTLGSTLQAIDATTGKSILSFGNNGVVDLREGLGREPSTILRVQSSTPGAIFENLLMLGSATGEDYFSTPGHIRAYDVITGKIIWTFHTIPQPGEYGYDTWPKDAYKYIGGVNTWGEISVDTKRGLAYFPVGSATYDYYGADRVGSDLFSTSLLALDARTGKRVWHFQLVHHDLWDYDPTAAPQLITVQHEGKSVDAVAQATKQGFLFVFDRVTGKPIWPIEERAVPPSDVPGERAWPTQPFPTVLPPFARQTLTSKDLTPFFLTEAERATWTRRIDTARKGLFTPPSLTQETIAVPGAVGGANWGNTAADPSRGIVYILNQDFPSFYHLEKQAPRGDVAPQGAATRGVDAYTRECSDCHGPRGEGGAAPAITGIGARMNPADFRAIVSMGGSQMPAFPHVDETAIGDIYAYLGGRANGQFLPMPSRPALPTGPVVESGGAPGPRAAREGARARELLGYPAGVAQMDRYTTDYGLGHPYIMAPPWSTLTAYDLNRGTIKWTVPIGQDLMAAKEGGTNTGVPRGTQRNGMIVTPTGLVFATAKDGHIYAFDAETGAVLWSGQLPMGTEGLPSMYEAGGHQYLVVNATTPLTWGKKSRESGIGADGPRGVGGYVVFGLP